MRARYYSPDMRRFVNADVIPGDISNAITLNRYAYANGNPVSNVDPFGLSADERVVSTRKKDKTIGNLNVKQSTVPRITSIEQARILYLAGEITLDDIPPQYSWDPSIRAQYLENQKKLENAKTNQQKNPASEYEITGTIISNIGRTTDIIKPITQSAIEKSILNSPRPNNIGKGLWTNQVNTEISSVSQKLNGVGYGITSGVAIINAGLGIAENIQNGETNLEIVSDAALDIGSGAVSIGTSLILAKAGTAISPGVGTLIGLGVGFLYDFVIMPLLDEWI